MGIALEIRTLYDSGSWRIDHVARSRLTPSNSASAWAGACDLWASVRVPTDAQYLDLGLSRADGRRYFASGSGRTWNLTAFCSVPGPPSRCQAA